MPQLWDYVDQSIEDSTISNKKVSNFKIQYYVQKIRKCTILNASNNVTILLHYSNFFFGNPHHYFPYVTVRKPPLFKGKQIDAEACAMQFDPSQFNMVRSDFRIQNKTARWSRWSKTLSPSTFTGVFTTLLRRCWRTTHGNIDGKELTFGRTTLVVGPPIWKENSANNQFIQQQRQRNWGVSTDTERPRAPQRNWKNVQKSLRSLPPIQGGQWGQKRYQQSVQNNGC